MLTQPRPHFLLVDDLGAGQTSMAGLYIMAMKLREQCLYLHYDGARYVVKITPNINQILEEEADCIRPGESENAIEDRLNRRLAGRYRARVWPKTNNVSGPNST
jgi:hypothetical protein